MFDSTSTAWLFAGGAALVTMIASFWSYLQSFYQQVASRVVLNVTVNGYQADAVQYFLKREFKASTWGPEAYLGWMLYVRPRRRVELVAMEVTPQSGRLYWRGRRPLWVRKVKSNGEDIESGVTARDYEGLSVALSFLRGTFDADKLIVDATECFNRQVVERTETQGRRHCVRHVYGTAGRESAFAMGRGPGPQSASGPSSNSDLGGCLHHRSLVWDFAQIGSERAPDGSAVDALALSDEAQELVDDVRLWKESEGWHKSRGLPWRRGWLLFGQPGTGKTALARAVAEDLDLPVFAFDLASLHNNELQQEWTQMLTEVPCMALIEDIDAVFNKRQNVSGRDRQHLTFDCLLNCMDGVDRADGLLVIITTNRLERVDAALGRPEGATGSTRPGRIDRVVELPSLDAAGREKIARRVLCDWPDEWGPIVFEGAGDTGAQFQERCARLAITLHYGGTKSDQAITPQLERDSTPSTAVESPGVAG